MKIQQNRYKAVVIGGSAGSFQGVTKILSQLPADFPLPIILCLHRLKHVRHGFVEALSIKSTKKVIEPYDKEPLKKGQVYLAPSNYHLAVELGNTFSLSTEVMVNNSRPSIDITFDSMAYVFRKKLIGILLSGANRDGAYGMKKIKNRGGTAIVQAPEECLISTMPEAAMRVTQVDHVMKIQEIVDFLGHIHKHY
ncbi:MAG: chemotaxis protein CheB [Cytophagales bacterium]|nr:chemotaxis protein CheB [Cytophagales bacterium]